MALTDEEKKDLEKRTQLQIAYSIIGNLDENALHTEWIDKAIEMLENLKHVRKNLPF